jgi:hypothetical protein
MEVIGMAHYVHHVPGRLRVQIPALKKNVSKARQLELYLNGMHGVLKSEVSIVTGSIVIKYDGGLVSSTTILNSLHDEGFIRNVHANHPVTYKVDPAQKVADTFVEKLVEAALERSAMALIAALI